MTKKQFLLVLFLIVFSIPFLGMAQDTLSLNFKETDLKVVLQSIAEKSGVNIIFAPEVTGTVSVKLDNINWQTALEVILRAYDYGYAKYKDVVIVAPMEKIKERETQEKDREATEPVQMKIFKLRFIDGNDAIKLVGPLLSGRGRATVLELTGQAGWEFGSDITKRRRSQEGRISRTKVLVVSDVARKLDEAQALLNEIDVKPKQILIRAKIMEVNVDTLRDIGFDWGTGSTGASVEALTFTELEGTHSSIGAHGWTSVTPSIFGPKEGTLMNVANTGLKFAFRKLTGNQFEVLLHTLEEKVNSNTLSAPSILTLNNQEASILVGTKFPIVKTEVSQETGGIVGGSLDRYQDIGIQLNVVPQICGENEDFINMILHPAVTSYSQTTKIQTATTVLSEYPIIVSREAETQVIVRNKETIVIGGLLKEVKGKQKIGIPFLSSIPILGWFFSRYTDDTEKIDLLVFITAEIVDPGEPFPEAWLNVKEFEKHFSEPRKKSKR